MVWTWWKQWGYCLDQMQGCYLGRLEKRATTPQHHRLFPSPGLPGIWSDLKCLQCAEMLTDYQLNLPHLTKNRKNMEKRNKNRCISEEKCPINLCVCEWWFAFSSSSSRCFAYFYCLLVCMSRVWMNHLYVTKDDDTSDHLTDGNTDTYWETDGGVGTHWIKLTMKPGTIIRYMIIYAESFLTVAFSAGNKWFKFFVYLKFLNIV